jgi:hypothetical protein
MTDGGDEYKREESVALLVIVFLAALSLLSVIAAFAYYCYITRKVSRRLQSFHIPKRSSSHHTLPPRALPPQQQGTDNPSSNSARDGVGAAAMSVVAAGERGVQVFSYRQLHAATGGFDRAHMVGQGSFGTVYRGVLPDGRKVAVKLMDRPGKQGDEEFEMEVKTIIFVRLDRCYSAPNAGVSTCWLWGWDRIHRVLYRVLTVCNYWIWPLRFGLGEALRSTSVIIVSANGSLCVGGSRGCPLKDHILFLNMDQ